MLQARFFIYLFVPISLNFFGSRKRRKDKEDISNKFLGEAASIDDRLVSLRNKNPLDSASSLEAISRATLNARQMQERVLNQLGSGGTAEALVGTQSNINGALGSTLGSIASGAEGNKLREESMLESLKASNLQSYGTSAMAAANERGSGWKDFFGALESISRFAEGAGKGVSSFLNATSK